MDIHNNSVEYQKGYEDGFKWSQYDYTYNHGPEYDAGFMAGYFEKNGRTFTGKTSAQIEAERQAQEEQYNQFNRQNNNFSRLVQTPYCSSGTILGKILDLLKSLLKLVLSLFIDSDMKNSQKVFGFVSSGTVKIIQALKGVVILLIIWAVISASSIFKGNNDSDKANFTDDKKPQLEKPTNNNDTKTNNTDSEILEANFEDEKTIKIPQNSSLTQKKPQENNKDVYKGVAISELDEYMRDSQERIKRNWSFPQNIEESNPDKVKLVATRFKISKDGSLLGVPVIEKSSGIERIDSSCIEAIKLTAPFKPLPKGFTDEYLEIYFTFEALKHSD